MTQHIALHTPQREKKKNQSRNSRISRLEPRSFMNSWPNGFSSCKTTQFQKPAFFAQKSLFCTAETAEGFEEESFDGS